MENKYKKMIYISLAIIILGCSLIIYGILSETKYDKELYAAIYDEYEKQIEEIEKVEVEEDLEINPEEKSKEYEEKMQDEDFNNKTIGVLKIPKLKISYPVIKETTDEYLKIAPTKYCGPDEPNTVGNLCITGHNYGTSSFFGNLDKLENEDMVIFMPNDGGTKVYEVYHTEIVEPENTSCLSQETNGNIEMTLITCAENSTKRLVVKCKVL